MTNILCIIFYGDISVTLADRQLDTVTWAVYEKSATKVRLGKNRRENEVGGLSMSMARLAHEPMFNNAWPSTANFRTETS